MNTNFKHKILAGAMMFGALFISSSCDDAEGLKVTPEVPYADKTLYQVITSDPQLTDFIEVINSCGEHCADSLFNKSRVYTVWAPVNGTFNKDSLMAEVQNGNRELVFRSFVKGHISNHLRAANGVLEDDNKILLLNEKMAVFQGNRKDGYTFAGQQLAEENIRVWNGILHKLANPAEYKFNIWEYLLVDARVDSVANFLYSYDETTFSPGQSIMGPIKNGEQTYLDSVFVTTNKLLNVWNGVGLLKNEDSLYTVYVPTNKVWNEVKEQVNKHFNYNMNMANPVSVTKADRDSLRNHYSRINILKYMTYSDNEQQYVEGEDSIMPAWQGTSVFVGRAEFPKAKLEEKVVFEKSLSNGTFKIVDEFPYNQFELWHDTIKLEAEDTEMRFSTQGSTDYMRTASKNQINKDSAFIGAEISGSRYYEGNSATTTVYAKFKLPNALSASYNVALIVVPKNITNPNVDPKDMLPNNFTVKISQETEKGNVFLYNRTGIKNDPTRLDTLILKENNGDPAVISVPYCEYYNTYKAADYNLVMEIQTPGSYKSYDKSIRLDAILLIPVKDPEE